MNNSEYEDYLTTSENYDQTRRANGIEILLGGFASLDRPLDKQTILDAGCGTGNYLKALDGKVASLYGIDMNSGMLSQARSKFPQDNGVQLSQGSILQLSYDDETFDGVMCNQVIHHLGTLETPDDFSNLRTFLSEVYRVLRAPGMLIINTCSQRQVYDGYWWTELIPEATEVMAKRYIATENLETMLQEVGFEFRGVFVPVDAILQKREEYLDPRAALRKEFRDGDSIWALSPEDEKVQSLERMRTMNEDNSMEKFIARRDQLRKDVGQISFVMARKNP